MAGNKLKGLSTVTGSLLWHILLGILFTWANLISYLTSYYKLHDSPNMKLEDGYFIMPLCAFVNTFSSIVGPILDNLIHVKLCTLLAIIILLISNYIFMVSTKIFYIYIAMGLLGAATGFSFIPLSRNCWSYYPKKMGFISGLLLFGYASSGLIFTSIADFMINPTNIKADKNTGLFNPDIANRVQIFLSFNFKVSIVVSVIVFFSIFQYDSKNDEAQNNNQLTSKNVENNNEDDDDIQNPYKQIFFDRRFYFITLMRFCGIIFGITLSNTYRIFGSLNGVNQQLLSILSQAFSLLNGGFRFVWGILFDKFSFKCLFTVCLINQIVLSFTMHFGVQIPYLYFFMVCNEACLYGGNVSLLIPIFPKVYGLKYFPYAQSVSNLICSASNLVFPILSKIIIKSNSDYKYLFFCGGAFTIVCLVILFLFKDGQFEYERNNHEEEHELIEQVGNA